MLLRPTYDAEGGRRCSDLQRKSLIARASDFTHVFVIVGDNDAKKCTSVIFATDLKNFESLYDQQKLYLPGT